MKVLIADDDPQLLRALRVTLKAHGYEIITASDGAEALSSAARRMPDLIMLDLGMPEVDGMDVIYGLRGWTNAPILVVSGRTDAADIVDALDAGADDYVTKPFSIDELLARIRACTRRVVEVDLVPVTVMGDVTIDLGNRAVTNANQEAIRLTPTEWRMLEMLVRNPGKLITRRDILTEIWGTQHVTDTGYLRLYMAQLRKKLERDPGAPLYLLTEPGMGYRFRPGMD